MRNKVRNQSKLKHYVLAPIRVLSRARDFYVKVMNDCVSMDYDGVVIGPSAPSLSRFPKSFSTVDSSSINDENLRKLLRRASSKRNNVNHVEINKAVGFDHMQRQRVMVRQVPVSMGYCGGGIMGRSYSVGLGKIGRIDEDRPCTFEEDDLNVGGALYTRSRSSYAVIR